MQGLEEGALYTRNQLRERGYHRSLQKGISGNQQQECNTIIISGARQDGLGDDLFHLLTYAAETATIGGRCYSQELSGKSAHPSVPQLCPRLQIQGNFSRKNVSSCLVLL